MRTCIHNPTDVMQEGFGLLCLGILDSDINVLPCKVLDCGIPQVRVSRSALEVRGVGILLLDVISVRLIRGSHDLVMGR